MIGPLNRRGLKELRGTLHCSTFTSFMPRFSSCSYASRHNLKVRNFLVDQMNKFKDSHSPKRIKRESLSLVCSPAFYFVCIALWLRMSFFSHTGAIHRYYESRRQLFLDSQPERAERAKITRQSSNNKALRKQV